MIQTGEDLYEIPESDESPEDYVKILVDDTTRLHDLIQKIEELEDLCMKFSSEFWTDEIQPRFPCYEELKQVKYRLMDLKVLWAGKVKRKAGEKL